MNSTENFQAGNLSILSHAGDSLCSSCTGLFKQPTKLLETEVGDPLKSPYRRLGKAVLESAETGCALCVLVWSRLSTLLRRQMNHQRLEEIMIGPSFGWHTDTQEFGNMVYWATDDGGDGSVFPELFKVDFSPTSGMLTLKNLQITRSRTPKSTNQSHWGSLGLWTQILTNAALLLHAGLETVSAIIRTVAITTLTLGYQHV